MNSLQRPHDVRLRGLLDGVAADAWNLSHPRVFAIGADRQSSSQTKTAATPRKGRVGEEAAKV
jgi:hypothetical protein